MNAIWRDLVIAIPSYKRPDAIQTKTLACLKHYGIPKEKIHVFVANEEQRSEYKEKLDPNLYGKLHIAEIGLVNARNFIFEFFPIGKPIVEFDDDIVGFLEYSAKARRNEKPLEDLKAVLLHGFEECRKADCRLWGVYPIPNGFFMKPGVSSDLKFCIGSFWGCFNPGKEIQIEFGKGEKEDYQRTLQFFMKDGAVIRLNYVAPKTAYYKEAGGLQAFGDRLETEKKVVAAIEKTWPSWVRRNPTRKSGFPEIKLVDPRTKEEKAARLALNPKYEKKGGKKTRKLRRV